MPPPEGTGARVNVRIVVRDLLGRVQRELETHNIVTDSGLDFIRDAMTPGTAASGGLNRCAFGSGSVAPAASDTELDNEIDSLRVFVTAAETTAGRLVISTYLSESDGNGNTISEIGLISATGVLYARALVAPPIEKTNGEAVSVIWTLDWNRTS